MEYKSGDIIKGRVTGIKPYGAFITLDDGYTGLLHISEISDDFVNHIEDFIKYGDEVELYVLDASNESKHLKLSLNYENQWIDAIGFNMGHLSEEYQLGDKVDIVGTLEINEFNGNEYLQINMKDIMGTY